MLDSDRARYLVTKTSARFIVKRLCLTLYHDPAWTEIASQHRLMDSMFQQA